MRCFLLVLLPVILGSRSVWAQNAGEADPAQAPTSGLGQAWPAAPQQQPYNPYAATTPPAPAPARPAPAAPPSYAGYQQQPALVSQPAPRQPTYYILAPPALPYLAGVPVPTGYHLRERANVGLRTGGLVTLMASYAAGLGYAFAHDFDNGTGWLAAPIVGPWGALGARHFECKAGQDLAMDPVQDQVDEANACLDSAFAEVFAVTFIGLDALLQATGLTLFVVGAASRQREWIRNDIKIAAGPHNAIKVAVGPRMLGRDSWGLGALGTF